MALLPARGGLEGAEELTAVDAESKEKREERGREGRCHARVAAAGGTRGGVDGMDSAYDVCCVDGVYGEAGVSR